MLYFGEELSSGKQKRSKSHRGARRGRRKSPSKLCDRFPDRYCDQHPDWRSDRHPGDTQAVLAHVWSVVDDLPGERSPHQRETVTKFILGHAYLFSLSEYDIGHTNLVQHVIDTETHKQLRPHPLAHWEITDQHVSDMLNHNIIEPAASPWASNVVLVRKSNCQLRFCVDYRSLNSVTYKDSYPLPRIDTN